MVKEQKNSDLMVIFEGSIFTSKPKADKFKLLLEKLVKTYKGQVKMNK